MNQRAGTQPQSRITIYRILLKWIAGHSTEPECGIYFSHHIELEAWDALLGLVGGSFNGWCW